MFTLTMPNEPREGYTVTWWELSDGHDRDTVNKRCAVYHVATRWEGFADRPGDDQYGADLVQQWMLYTDGNPTGRVDGWRGLGRFLHNPYGRNRFGTPIEAYAELVKRLTAHRDRVRGRLEEAEAMLRNARGRLLLAKAVADNVDAAAEQFRIDVGSKPKS